MNSIPPVSTDFVIRPRPRPRGARARASQWFLRLVFAATTLGAALAGLRTPAGPVSSARAAEVGAVQVAAAQRPRVAQPTVTVGSATAAADSKGGATCPAGMVEVEGEYCPAVAHRCVKWISEKRDRCAKYEATNRCFGEPVVKRFCMDRFEYPNQAGVRPEVGMTWEQAQAKCEADGKRLCTSSEWTTACEGPERTPYPNGYERGACNVDQPYIMPNDQAFRNPATRAQEIERLSQSEPAGARDECVSHYGAYDLTGNVDEWVVNENGSPDSRPYQSGLKGGYWGPVRNRCRPMTVDHNAWHAGYQIGFRCCADLPASE